MAVKTIETKLRLKVMHDNYAKSPIEMDCILGKFICLDENYSLGHKHKFEDEVDLFKELAYKYNPDKVKELKKDLDEEKIVFDYYVNELKTMVYSNNEIYILPLFFKEHSNKITTLGFGSDWDDYFVGYIYTTKHELDCIGCVYDYREDVEEMLKSEVDLLDKYLKGEVYGFSIVEYDEKYNNEYNTIESHWGFYGNDMDDNGMIFNISSLSREEIDSLLIYGTNAIEYLI